MKTDGRNFLFLLRDRRPELKAWRDPKTGRRWPDFCAFRTDPLDGEELEVVRDLVMTDFTGDEIRLAVGKWEAPSLLARLLATAENSGLSDLRHAAAPWLKMLGRSLRLAADLGYPPDRKTLRLAAALCRLFDDLEPMEPRT